MSQPENPPKAWLFEDGTWQQVDDPIPWRDDGDVRQERKDAGYIDQYGHPAARVYYPGTEQESAGLTLWVRDEHPQCLIDIEWSMATRSVYAARFPDGLDLMAKWAPIFYHAALPAPATS